MFPLARQQSAVSLRRQAHFHADDNAPAAEPRASPRNRWRNPGIVRMALTLSKDPAAGGAGEAGDCDRGTRKTLIASASGLNSQLTLWSSLAFLLPSPRMCWTLRNALVRCLCACLCHTRRSARCCHATAPSPRRTQPSTRFHQSRRAAEEVSIRAPSPQATPPSHSAASIADHFLKCVQSVGRKRQDDHLEAVRTKRALH